MAHTKRAATGTLIKVNTTEAPTAYTTIPGVGDFNVPLGERDDIDVTSHDSPNATEESVTGIARLPAFNTPMLWDSANAQQAQLAAAHAANTPVGLQILLVDSSTLTGSAYVKNIEFQNPVNGKFDANVSFKWAARPTRATGS